MELDNCVQVHLGQLRLQVQLLDTNSGDTGAQLWCGGLLLAAWLASQSTAALLDREVLELGCGVSALPSAVAALKGAAHVMATDGVASLVELASSNLKLNSALVTVQQLDWQDIVDNATVEKIGFKGWDLLIFADVIYTRENAALLATCINILANPEGEIIGALCGLMCGCQEFMEEMLHLGFAAKQLHCAPDLLLSIDSGDVFADQDEARRMRPCYPTSASVLVSWQRQRDHPDDSARLICLLGEIQAAGLQRSEYEVQTHAAELAARQPLVTVGMW